MISTAVGRVEQRKKKSHRLGVYGALLVRQAPTQSPLHPFTPFPLVARLVRPPARERASDRLLTGIEHRPTRQ